MINALQKTLKGSQYMQNILCFGVFARDDASDNCCDSRLNLNCHPLSEERARLGGFKLVKTTKMPYSDCKQSSGMTKPIMSPLSDETKNVMAGTSEIRGLFHHLSPLSDCKERIRGLRISKNGRCLTQTLKASSGMTGLLSGMTGLLSGMTGLLSGMTVGVLKGGRYGS